VDPCGERGPYVTAVHPVVFPTMAAGQRVRFTLEELLALRACADTHGLGIAAFARESALRAVRPAGAPPAPRTGPPAPPEAAATRFPTLAELRRLAERLDHPAARDPDGLAGVFAAPRARLTSDDMYPDDWRKAAALISAAARLGPAGDLRFAWAATWTFLMLNGHAPDPAPDPDEAARFVRDIRRERYDVPEIAARLRTFAR
jgi:death on curing protein